MNQQIDVHGGAVDTVTSQGQASDQGVVGRYILTPKIFDKLRTTGQGAGGEIQLTDAIAELLKEAKVYAYSFKGRRYDCGSKLGYLEATVEYALCHEELKEDFCNYLKKLECVIR